MKMSVRSSKLLFTSLLIIVIFFIRFSSQHPALVGDESYYSLRISEEIKNQAVISEDPLGEPYTLSALDYLISPLSQEIKIFLPLILGLLLGFFYYKIIDKQYATLSTSLLYLSPLFLTTFTSLTNEMLAVFLVILNAYVLKKGRVIMFTIIQTLIALTHFEIWFLSSIYFVYTKKNYVAFIPGVILSTFVFQVNFGLEKLFSELGASYGYSLFFFLLGVIGFVWRKKEPSTTVLLLIGFLITVFLPETRLLGTLVLLPYASKAISKLLERKWELSHIRQATIFLIFLVIVFSSVAKASEITSSVPTNIDSYKKLESMNSGLVLAVPEEGHYIQYFAKKPIVVDSRSSEEEKSEIEALLASQNAQFVHKELLSKNITYIIINPSEERKGFLFVADNSENLSLLDSETIELWEFRR